MRSTSVVATGGSGVKLDAHARNARAARAIDHAAFEPAGAREADADRAAARRPDDGPVDGRARSVGTPAERRCSGAVPSTPRHAPASPRPATSVARPSGGRTRPTRIRPATKDEQEDAPRSGSRASSGRRDHHGAHILLLLRAAAASLSRSTRASPGRARSSPRTPSRRAAGPSRARARALAASKRRSRPSIVSACGGVSCIGNRSVPRRREARQDHARSGAGEHALRRTHAEDAPRCGAKSSAGVEVRFDEEVALAAPAALEREQRSARRVAHADTPTLPGGAKGGGRPCAPSGG